MSKLLSPYGAPPLRFTDANGNPLNGGQIETYLAGTTTPKATYKNRSGAALHANPIVLLSDGWVPGGAIWLDTDEPGYKFVLKTSAGVTLLTVDEIRPLAEPGTALQSAWISGPAPTFIDADEFSVEGDQRGLLHVNRRLRLTDATDLYGTITAAAYDGDNNITTVALLLDSGNLSAALTALAYSLLSAEDDAIPRPGGPGDVGTLQTDVAALLVVLFGGAARGFGPGSGDGAGGGDATNDLTIQPGATVTAAGVLTTLASAMTKRADATWAAGSGNGGMRSGGTWAAGTWYIWLIREDATGAADVYFDDSVSGANAPAGWTPVYLIFTQRTGSASWIAVAPEMFKPLQTRVYRTNVQSITHNTDTPVAWDTSAQNPLGAYAPGVSTNRIRVPDGLGITHLRVTGNAHFETQTDYRSAVLLLAFYTGGAGSGGIVGAAHITVRVSTDTSWAPQMNACTDWIPCEAGDEVDMRVLHQRDGSGASNLIGSGLATWLSVEFKRGNSKLYEDSD
jgi:hypothetical protein